MASRIRSKVVRGRAPQTVRRSSSDADSKGTSPLYIQVARSLKDAIVSGAYPVGSLLPTEVALCERYAVSRHTVRAALRLLRDDSLVTSRRGAGTVVAAPRSSESDSQEVMSIDDLLAFGTGTRFVIESINMIALDAKLAARTGLPQGEDWLQVCGRRLAQDDDTIVCLAEYYINRTFAAVGRLLQRHTGPIFPLIEDMFGQGIVEVHQQISATLVWASVADSLAVEAGTPALEVRRTYKTGEEKVAQVTLNTHPAARFQHSMTMRRVKT